MTKSEKTLLFIAIALILLIGFTSGYTMGHVQASQTNFPEIKPVEDTNPGITTIKFLELEGGILKGEISGQKARLAYEANPETIVDLPAGSPFEIPIYQVSLGQYYTVRDLPEGINFIASSSGKYYYSILDPRAFRITPKNRIYFNQKEEAENKGYLPPK